MFFFFFNDTATTEIYTLSLHDALPISVNALAVEPLLREPDPAYALQHVLRLQELTTLRRIAQLKSKLQRTNPVEEAAGYNRRSEEHTSELQSRQYLVCRLLLEKKKTTHIYLLLK